eukprot:gb/GEZN01003103.1/.p1 GENE.gb/GEZN01003103.1/~~gb/GEZN01003103.1/.p1  ORF type:complete len:719 (-),score=69.78 gb/GEZN01003103.1/:90-2246(-)
MLFFLFPLWVFASHLGGYEALQECIDLEGRLLRVGVLYEESAAYSFQLFYPTFQTYLTSSLLKHGCAGTELVVLDHHEMHDIMEVAFAVPPPRPNVSLDLVFVSPGLVTALRRSHPGQLELLATATRYYNLTGSKTTSQLAGALVRAAGRHPGLVEWQDLANQTLTDGLFLCAVRNDSFSGWQIQEVQLLQEVGARLEDVFHIKWAGSQDQVLDMLYDGLCDVAAVGTPTLERLAESGSIFSARKLPLNTWSVIGQQTSTSAGLPFLHSTQVFPEWGVLRLPQLAYRLADLLRSALLTLQDSDPAAIQGQLAGFTFPADYKQAALVEYHLNVFGDGRCIEGSERQTSGLLMCDFCSPGSFSSTGVGPCQRCAQGKFSASPGASACSQCSAGFTSYVKGSTGCVPFELQFEPIAACAQYDNHTMVVGVLMDKGASESEVYERWAPTFEDTINTFMGRFDCYMRMVVLEWDALLHALDQQSVEFIFVDAGKLAVLHRSHGVEVLASVINQYQSIISAYQGGVIFRKKDAHQDVHTLEDIASLGTLSACPVDEDDFEGWIAQRYQFFQHGLDANASFASLVFSHGHEASVEKVMNGECDVGMVRTNTLEHLQLQGKYNLSSFALINSMHVQAESKHSNFHLWVSTDLYHSWAFARLPSVPHSIWSDLQVPILAMREHDQASLMGKHAGFFERRGLPCRDGNEIPTQLDEPGDRCVCSRFIS